MQVLYEDNHLIAVSKTCNEIVQGDKTGDTPLCDMLKQYVKDKYDKPGDVFIGVPHRLDRPTSGVVLFARTSKALVRLNEMFRQKSQPINPSSSQSVNSSFHQSIIKKTYWAIVEHAPVPAEGTLEHWLVRNEKLNKSFIVSPDTKDAKQALLTYRTLSQGERYTLLEINLLTGRHHQIRCQLAGIGCPIKGDLKYGARRSNPDGGICLHARQVDFVHPVKKEPISITAPVPNESLWHTLVKNVCFVLMLLLLLTCCACKQHCDGFSLRSATCPRAEGETEYRLVEQQVPFVSFLQKRGMTIIPIYEEDEMHYANNFLTIAPRHIMAVGGQSPALQQTFLEHNVAVEWVPLEQLIKGYGAAHCMTQVILRR